MQDLSSHITKLTQQFGYNLHQSAINYIVFYVTGYQEILMSTDNINDILNWSQQVFPETVVIDILEQVPKVLGDNVNSQIINQKERIISLFISYIIKLSNSKYELLPWDLQTSIIINDKKLKESLVLPDTNIIPIIVVINNATFTHFITEETLAGILLISSVSSTDFNVICFDSTFDMNYFTNINEKFLLKDDNKKKYKITIDNVQYAFDTLDFIKGIKTGCEWIDKDHKNYWSNFLSSDDSVMYEF